MALMQNVLVQAKPMGLAYNGLLRARNLAVPVSQRLLSSQDQLPRLPVPALQQTMDKLLSTVRPLVTDDRFQYAQQLVSEFAQAGGIGEKLQSLLLKKADTSLNWLEDWWLNVAYLQYRAPCPVHVSPGVILPSQDFKDAQDQLRFAAKFVRGVVDYKVQLDDKSLPVDYLGGEPLCMSQYFKILCSCRVPGIGSDSVAQFLPDQKDSPKHMVVIHNNHFFSMDLYDSSWKPLSTDQILQQLTKMVQRSETDAPPVGILTSDHRDNWAETFKMLTLDAENRQTIEAIQKSIMVLCLDKAMPPASTERMSQLLEQMNYGGSSKHNSSNRWFDKTLQLVIGRDGAVGLTYEHCAAEGPPVISISDHAYSYTQQENQQEASAASVDDPIPLTFNIGPKVQQAMLDSADRLDKMVSDLQFVAYHFTPFGKEFIKSQKLSPDAFIQVSLQLAYYRLHGKPTATYESGSLRRYLHGRTETIRSCSSASLKYCETMAKDTSPLEKVQCLREAVAAHSKYTRDVVAGQGIDRHLLGLKLIAKEHKIEVPDFFNDPIVTDSMYWKLSTSQVPSQHESLLCFGAVVNDGYGICYNPRPHSLLMSFSSWNSCEETSAKRLSDAMHAALVDAHDILLLAQPAKL